MLIFYDFREFSKHFLLLEEEIDVLFALTYLLSRDDLCDKVIFQVNLLGLNNTNFYFAYLMRLIMVCQRNDDTS